jgi:hypothetical protein
MFYRLKDNWTTILIFCLMLIIGYKGVTNYISSNEKTRAIYLQYYEVCKNTDSTTETISFCNQYNSKNVERDVISTFGYILLVSDDISSLQVFAPLLVMIAAAFTFHKYLRKGYFKNSLTRLSYKDAFKNIYLKAQKNALIVPTFLFIILICSCFISKNFNLEYGVSDHGFSFVNEYNSNHILSFLLVYFLNFILQGIFWINIVVYNCKNNKNVIIAIITSFVFYFLLLIGLQYDVGELLLASSPYKELFNLCSIWSYNNLSKTSITLVSVILVIISSLFVYKAYHDKENVLEEISK